MAMLRPPSKARPAPSLSSSLWLALANAVVCFLLILKNPRDLLEPDVNLGFGLIFAAIAMGIVLAGSTVFHLICVAVEQAGWMGSARLRNRILIYLLPALFLGLLRLYGVAVESRDYPNQLTPLTSPSGKFELKMRPRAECWYIEIRDARGNPLLIENTRFSGFHGGYWLWDDADRVWFRSGDLNQVAYWYREEGGWTRSDFDWNDAAESPESPLPPRNLYRSRYDPSDDRGVREYDELVATRRRKTEELKR